MLLSPLAIIECEIKTLKYQYEKCVTEKPNHVGPSLWSRIRVDSYTTWKNRKKKEEKVGHIVSLFNGIFSSSSSSKISCKAEPTTGYPRHPSRRSPTLLRNHGSDEKKTKNSTCNENDRRYYPSIKHDTYQDVMLKYTKNTTKIR